MTSEKSLATRHSYDCYSYLCKCVDYSKKKKTHRMLNLSNTHNVNLVTDCGNAANQIKTKIKVQNILIWPWFGIFA